MKDNQLRGLLLHKLYEHRKESQDMSSLLSPADFSFPMTEMEIIRIGSQLEEHGLAKCLNSMGNIWRITAYGVVVVERGGIGSPIEVKITNTNISHSVGVVVGNNNSQDIRASFTEILSAIDKAPASSEEKLAAKNLFGQFLKHPLVTSIAGGATQALLKTILPDHK
jgi:hypothetical protein